MMFTYDDDVKHLLHKSYHLLWLLSNMVRILKIDYTTALFINSNHISLWDHHYKINTMHIQTIPSSSIFKNSITSSSTITKS